VSQISYARLWDGFKTDEEARKARDRKAAQLRDEGRMVQKWTLRNQQKLDDHGQTVGVCPVYYINVI